MAAAKDTAAIDSQRRDINTVMAVGTSLEMGLAKEIHVDFLFANR
jgi:hypothetical protein